MLEQESPVVAYLFCMLGGLFALGALVGAFLRWAGRRLGLGDEGARTASMTVALLCVLTAGGLAAAAGVWFLSNYQSSYRLVTTIISGPDRHGLALPDVSLTLSVDALAALFLVLMGSFAAVVAVYSFGWLAGDEQRASVAAGFNLFVATTLLVLVVSNAFWLLLALEAQSLSFVYLVLYRGQRYKTEADQARNRRALRTYLIVGHVSTMCLAVAVLLMASVYGSLDMHMFGAATAQASPLRMNTIFVLALVGIGSRAGMVPFHFWVPIVHPESPTTTHAFSLGVSIKVAIYLMIRFFFQYLGPVQWWWGVVLLFLAGLTAVVNVFYAILSPDLKRALAYHSVENVGIIMAGLGMALMFASTTFAGMGTIAGVVALGLIAALFHTFNHAIFKGLLYLGTGAIERLTHTVQLDELGGVLRRWWWTGSAFLIGAIAIAGFPPLNGFVSEWLTLQTVFAGIHAYQQAPLVPIVMLSLCMILILLGLSFALTALAFVKIAGETLLGFPRRRPDSAVPRSDVSWPMRSVLTVFAVLCLVLGLFPMLLMPWLVKAVEAVGVDVQAQVLRSGPAGLTVSVPGLLPEERYDATLAIVPILALVVLPLATVVTAQLVRRAKGPYLHSPAWVGGERYDAGRMQYTGAAFSSLIWEPQATGADPQPSGPLPASFSPSHNRHVPERFTQLYNRGILIGLTLSGRFGNRVQSGDIRTYVLFIFAAFMAVLIVLVAIKGPP